MKINLLWLSIAMLLLSSCGQNDKGKTDKKKTTGEIPSAAAGKNVIRFKADGETVNSEGWVVQRFVWSDTTTKPWLNIVSNMNKDKRSINVNLKGAEPGTYSFTENAGFNVDSYGTYFPDYFDTRNNYTFISGSFTITDVDTLRGLLNGTFSGVVKSNDGKTITITEGQLINVEMKAGVTNLADGLEK